MKQSKLLSPSLETQTPPEVPSLSNKSGQISSNAVGGNIDPTFNASVTEGSGYVNETVVQPDGKIIAVGFFHSANGTRNGGIARFNADGTLDATFNSGIGANAIILAVALQSDGKIIIGGNFNSYQGQAINRLARLNSDGSLDITFLHNLNFSSQIHDITVQPNGKILVGGGFNALSGNSLRGRIVRVNSDGTIDSTFNNGGMNAGANGTVYKIIYLADNKILVGGNFSFFNSNFPASGVVRLNNDGTVDTSFSTGQGTNHGVREMAIQADGKILVSGFFTQFDNMQTDSIVRLNENGSLANTFETNHPADQNTLVFGLALQPDGKIVVGISDNSLLTNGQVLRFNTDATIDNTFSAGNIEKSAIRGIVSQADGKLIIAGDFTTFNNQSHLHIVRTESNGTLDANFNPSISITGVIYAIKKQTDGKIIIAGDFEFVNGVRKGAIARLNADGSIDNTFALIDEFVGDIFAVEVQSDGKIIIGGKFFVGDDNFSAYNVVRLNSDGSFDINLNASSDFVNIAYALALQPDGKILIGGIAIVSSTFEPIALTRVLSNGNPDLEFHSPLLSIGFVRDILVQLDGKIIFGGTFFPSGSGTLQRNGIARLNNDGSLDSGFSAPVGNVYSLEQQADGKILAGGFSLTRFTPDGEVDPTLNVGSGFNNLIRDIEVMPDGKILLGGFFTTYNENPVNRIIKINDIGNIDPTFDVGSGPSAGVNVLELQNDGKILVGGQFLDFNNTETSSLVRL